MDFEQFAAQDDARLDLLEGALLIAKDAYPGMCVEVQRHRVDRLAEPLIREGVGDLAARAQTVALAAYLGGDCGLRGNREDYYDPRNSFVNDVLDRGLGIPISLGVVYVEVARRAGISASGVGFPGHFLVRVEDADEIVILDPFSGGRLLDAPALEGLFRQATRSKGPMDEEVLRPTPSRHILARMLMNLRSIYMQRGEYARLLVVLDRFMDLVPDAANELRDRGYLWARLGAPQAALADLERYVQQFPHAGDVAEVRRVVDQLIPLTEVQN